MTNQEKLDYLVSPLFKAHHYNGGDPVEVEARTAFIRDVINYPLQLADTNQITNLGNVARWMPSGLDTIFRGIVENGAKIDALTAAFTGAIAALQGGAPFDQEKFLASVQTRVAAGVKEGFSATGDLTFTLQSGAKDKAADQ